MALCCCSLPMPSEAFAPSLRSKQKPSTAIFYVNEGGPNNDKKTTLTMPVLGPWVEQPPLLPGSVMELKDVTELQYQSLAYADNKDLLATPVVALLDHYTPHSPDPGRYATLAAVLGYSETPNPVPPSYFMESIRGESQQRNIHLLGIGRGLVTNLCYESTKQDAMDEEGFLLECEIDGDPCENSVIVGNVQIVQDSIQTKSPVQAVTACAQLYSQVSHWHSERQKLIEQIQAEDELFQDFDGIGDLFSFSYEQISTPRSHLEQLENYGMGTSPFSSIQELTQTAMNALSPYYSPGLLATEDFYYQAGSWAALAALSCYVEPPHLAWAVRCTDTTERWMALEDWMHSHVKLLQQCVATPSNNR